MATAFVTGATGFVGSHIVRTLLENGHQVRILRRASSRLDALEGLTVEHAIGDLFDVETLAQQLAGVDWVFHVAAVANYWRSRKDEIYRVNVDGTANLLQAAERAGVKRFIFTSSLAAVGYRGSFHSANEKTYFNTDPRLSPYGHSKFLAEAKVQQAVRRGLDGVILNPSIIIGPGDLNQISGSLVIEVARRRVPVLPQRGGANFIDVRDVARAHLVAAQRGRKGERYIIGAVNMTHKAMIRLIAQVVGVPAPFIPMPSSLIPAAAALVDVGRRMGLPIPAEGNQLRLSRRTIYADCRKMWAELHEPEIDIRQSIEDTYAWYKANGYL